jgi:hypothetical protein
MIADQDDTIRHLRATGSEDRLHGIAFRYVLQIPIPGEQESVHVAREEQRFHPPPQDPQGGAKRERIHHERSRWVRDEGMVMPQFLKDAPDHLINKVLRALIRRDFGGEMLREAKMDRFPRHGISQVHDAGGHPSNRALVGMRHRVAMEVNAERQIETPLWRSSNHRFEANGRHPSRALLVQPNKPNVVLSIIGSHARHTTYPNCTDTAAGQVVVVRWPPGMNVGGNPSLSLRADTPTTESKSV